MLNPLIHDSLKKEQEKKQEQYIHSIHYYPTTGSLNKGSRLVSQKIPKSWLLPVFPQWIRGYENYQSASAITTQNIPANVLLYEFMYEENDDIIMYV